MDVRFHHRFLGWIKHLLRETCLSLDQVNFEDDTFLYSVYVHYTDLHRHVN